MTIDVLIAKAGMARKIIDAEKPRGHTYEDWSDRALERGREMLLARRKAEMDPLEMEI